MPVGLDGHRGELVEALTHLAFYRGWPTAVTALARLQEVLDDAGPTP